MKQHLKIYFIICLLVSFYSHAQVQKPTDAVCVVNFLITDYDMIPEEMAEIHVLSKTDKTLVTQGVADVEGKFSANLEEGKEYEILVKKFGKTFDFPLVIPVVEGPLEFNQKLKIRLITRYIRTYTLQNVLFDVDKYDLRKDSHKPINLLFNELKANPKMKIELAGHTDSDGDDHRNMTLSQNRANSVMNYLIEKGIDKSRIIAKGYGETAPIADNHTPDGKQQNRRTEVRVIEE